MEQAQRTTPEPPHGALHHDKSNYHQDDDEDNFEDDDSYYSDDLDEEGSDLDDDSFASESTDGGIVAQEYKKEKNQVAAKEHTRVFRARIFVLLLLAVTAVSNAVIVYFLTLNKEEKDYYEHYNALTDEIMQVMGENVRMAYIGMDAMSDGLSTRVTDGSAAISGNGWPFVTISNYPSLAGDARNVTGALQIVLIPLLEESERIAWETYSAENNDWLRQEKVVDYNERRNRALLEYSNQTHPLVGADDNSNLVSLRHTSWQEEFNSEHLEAAQQDDHNLQQHKQEREKTKHSKARQLDGDHDFRGVIPERIHPAPTRPERLTPGMRYAPVWQMSPAPYYRGITNHDMLREPSFLILNESVAESRRAVLSSELHNDLVGLLFERHYPLLNEFDQVPDTIQYQNDEDDRHRHGDPWPTSVMLQPVWENLGVNPSLVAYQIAFIPWGSYLVNTFLPSGDESVLIQYEYNEYSPCDTVEDQEAAEEIITEFENYKVFGGDNVEYLGPGEDGFTGSGNYDFAMKRTLEFPVEAAPTRTNFLVADNSTQPPMPPPNPECTNLRVHLYPSDELRSIYMTSWPTYYAWLVILVFSILVSAFFIYDFTVERRRGKVMAVANQTNRIVTSLFPSQFADQMMSDTKKKEKEEKKRRKKKVILEEAPTRQLKKYMKDTDKKAKKDWKKKKRNGKSKSSMDASTANVKSEYGEGTPDSEESPLFLAQSKPIADLFPETTVLFTDIAGFTAWSSVRDPSQVFTLLETVYASFDFVAKQYGIFKIETIGDCYVAVCGLPEPRVDHAVAMSRFAQVCMTKMKDIVSQLEVTLGPDTGDLTMRFGLHSGPVTAGILRGERARFQLFGDTVNTAARMESTGMKDKIQISQETADLLIAAGKSHWFVKRDGLVKAKGKGELQTYWLTTTGGGGRRGSIGGAAEGRSSIGHGPISRRGSVGARRASLAGSRAPSTRSNTSFAKSQPNGTGQNPALLMGAVLSKKEQRLVDWNCELLQQLLRQIVARRNFVKNASRLINVPFTAMMSELPKIGGKMLGTGNTTPLDEVVEVINLAEFDEAAYRGTTDAKQITLDAMVVTQLRRYVTILASKYRDNPFHNFDHASHVAMSCSKLLTRIVAPDLASIADRHASDEDGINETLHLTNDMKDLHDHTYGITSDPLTQFAVVLSALIHDVDHRGVPNNILATEEPEMAAKYDNKSIAEQNSVDIAWNILMDDSFKALRDTVCGEFVELKRLRALVVNSVLATDIFDKDLGALRKARWDKAFSLEPESESESSGPPMRRLGTKQGSTFKFGSQFGMANRNNMADINRKATIVIEHLIQASDVAHTMQHWHIYTKWNECLFKEMYTAFKEGRSDKDPSEGWYKGELWFYDNYVIPLAKKLKDCGVFGVSSDEYLDYATANRNEWEEKGEAIVKQMQEKYKSVVERSSLGYE